MSFSTDRLTLINKRLVVPTPAFFAENDIESIMNAVLDTVGKKHCDLVIIDMSSTEYLDSLEFASLLQIAQMVQVMGPQVVLSGLRAGVVRFLIEQSIDMHGIPVFRDVEDALDSKGIRAL